MDAGWIERGNQRFAQYTNLGPGKYRFLVDVVGAGVGAGLESRRARRWRSRSGRSCGRTRGSWRACAAAIALLVFVYIRWRTRSLRVRAIELERVVEERTRDLREQTSRLLVADEEKTRLLHQLQDKSEAFERQAREDALTGLQNRRSLDEGLARAYDVAVRTQQPLSFALLDIDNFKRINDEYSHAAGDEALREVARVLLESLNHDALLARWGGEEFAVLFPATPLEQARARCETARAAIEALNCDAFAPGLAMTLSGGVCDRTGLSHHEKLRQARRSAAVRGEAGGAEPDRRLGRDCRARIQPASAFSLASPSPAAARYRRPCPDSTTPTRCPAPSATARGPGGRSGPGRRCRCTCPWRARP